MDIFSLDWIVYCLRIRMYQHFVINIIRATCWHQQSQKINYSFMPNENETNIVCKCFSFMWCNFHTTFAFQKLYLWITQNTHSYSFSIVFYSFTCCNCFMYFAIKCNAIRFIIVNMCNVYDKHWFKSTTKFLAELSIFFVYSFPLFWLYCTSLLFNNRERESKTNTF